MDDIWVRIESLKTLCFFRINNIEKQLSGEISTTNKENYDSFNLLGEESCKTCGISVDNKDDNPNNIDKEKPDKYFSFY